MVRVTFDLTEFALLSEIASQMQKGVTRDEAEKIIDKEGGVDGLKGVVDIKSFGGDINIKIPDAHVQNTTEVTE